MCALIKKALAFVYSLKPAVLERFSEASLRQLDIGVTSADATQGETYEVDIKAFYEYIDEWSEWCLEPQRILTTFSRANRQTVMPQLKNAKFRDTMTKSMLGLLQL